MKLRTGRKAWGRRTHNSVDDKARIVEALKQPFNLVIAKLSEYPGLGDRIYQAYVKPIVDKIDPEVMPLLAEADHVHFSALGADGAAKLSFHPVALRGYTGQSYTYGVRKIVLDPLDERFSDYFEQLRQIEVLKEDRGKLTTLLTAYLAGFQTVEQLAFSFPQLVTFLPSDKQNVRAGRRPSYVNLPGEELKALVLKAMVLKG